jgi:hypothetical protein
MIYSTTFKSIQLPVKYLPKNIAVAVTIWPIPCSWALLQRPPVFPNSSCKAKKVRHHDYENLTLFFSWARSIRSTLSRHISLRSILILLLHIRLTASLVYWPEFLAADPEVRVRFLALPDFLKSSGSGTGSTKPRECNWGAAWKKK